MMRMKSVVLLLGMVFGFALTRVRASEYDMIYRMFVGSDLTVAWVILGAIAVGLAGMKVLRMLGDRTIDGSSIKVSRKSLDRASLAGAALFGAGWGLSGACPGTVLAQIGSGRILGLFTLLGMIAGTYAYALVVEEEIHRSE